MSWNEQNYQGSWIKGETAGGCDPDLDPDENTFDKNPSIAIQLEDSDDDNDFCTMIVALTQKCVDRDLKARIGEHNL